MFSAKIILTFVLGMSIGSLLTLVVLNFNAGTISITETKSDGIKYTLELNQGPSELVKRHFVSFKVSKKSH